MAYERKHKVGIDEVNKELLMTNRSIVTSFENTATFYSDSINFGILDIPKTMLTWFIVDWKVEVIKRPRYADEITIKTWSRNANKSFSYMDFEIYVNNTLYVKATSKWVLYNLKTKAYENIPDELMKKYGNNHKSVFEESELAHMHILDKYTKKRRINIKNSDLDFNNHVNNVKYFDYLIDYSNATEYNHFRITYRKEIKLTDIVYLHYSKVNNKSFYAIIDKNNNVKTIIECE